MRGTRKSQPLKGTAGPCTAPHNNICWNAKDIPTKVCALPKCKKLLHLHCLKPWQQTCHGCIQEWADLGLYAKGMEHLTFVEKVQKVRERERKQTVRNREK